ncbi:MAG: putative glycoside hydrolase [Chloroflexota bacterium]|nr:putative glycoside hydrolase [Chloroflexota bacterium]
MASPADIEKPLRGQNMLFAASLVAFVALVVLVALFRRTPSVSPQHVASPLVSGTATTLPSDAVVSTTSLAASPTVYIPGMPSCTCIPTTPAPPEATQQAAEPTSTAHAQATPLSTSPPAGSVFGLAWFHKPPDIPAATVAAEHRYIHLTGRSDIPYRNELRAAGYTGPIYSYVSAGAVGGPGPYKSSAASCDATYEEPDNTVAWNKGDFCRYIHPHESWFLHNSKGERLFDDYFGTGHLGYLMNPADTGWQAFSYERFQYVRDTLKYDGVWLDNLDLTTSRGKNEMKNSDGVVKEYGSDDAWRTAVQGWLAGLRKHLGSYPIWANVVYGDLDVAAWDPYSPYVDGAMDESFSVRWLDGWRDPDAWKAQLDRSARWLAAGKGLVMVGQGAKDDLQRMRFTLASYMLVATGQNAFFRYTRFDSYYNELWLYPEFNTARALGAPVGERSEVSPGVWRRQFANGYVEVDVTGHTGRLVLGEPR